MTDDGDRPWSAKFPRLAVLPTASLIAAILLLIGIATIASMR